MAEKISSADNIREEIRLLVYGRFSKEIKTIYNDEREDTLRIVFKDGAVRLVKVS